MRSFLTLVSILGLVLFFGNPASATTLFFEGFESDMSNWFGKGGGAHNGIIVPDPLGGPGNVLTFSATNAAGDIFTQDTFSSHDNRYILSFDYLGTCNGPDCGGFIGFSKGTPSSHGWFNYSYPLGHSTQWQHVTIEFTPGEVNAMIAGGPHYIYYNYSGGSFSANDPIHLMVEDWYSPGPPRDAFFDNILLTDGSGPSGIPEPSTLLLLSAGVLGLFGYARRRTSVTH